jgi:hypothetical protein
MKKTVLIALSMLLAAFAAEVLAAEPVYLPTTIYRNDLYDGNIKIELAYDEFGHITSEKKYYPNGEGGYEETPYCQYLFEYHLLHNGKFVQSVFEESGYKKEVRTYDDKGMMLSSKYYDYDDYKDDWVLYSGMETVLDDNGVRTGIKVYYWSNPTWELHPGIKFDHKGRTIEFSEEYGDYYKRSKLTSDRTSDKQFKTKTDLLNSLIHRRSNSKDTERNIATWTWDDNDQLLEFSMKYEDGDYSESLTVKDIETVRNGEYFNVYALIPFMEEIEKDEHSPIFYIDLPIFAWDDYTKHEWFFNGLIIKENWEGENGELTINSSYNHSTKETTRVIKEGNYVIVTTVFKEKANNSWSIVEIQDDGELEEEGKEYNGYGVLTKNYYLEIDEDDDYFMGANIYNREYDNEGRPVKTTRLVRIERNHGSSEDELYEETYDAWTSWTGWTEIKTPIVPRLDVYPTITSGMLYIDNPYNEIVRLYNVSGVQLIEVRAQSINISAYPKGMYILVTGNRTAKIIKN